LLRQVEAAGLDPGRLVPAGAAEVTVILPEAGWATRNLGALVAHQRAVPTQSAELLEQAGSEWRSTGIIAIPARRPPPEPTGGAPRRVLLSGAGGPLDAVLLDRDGTLIVDRNYLADPDRVALLPGAVEGLRRLEAAGIRRVVVTNQSGVARGWIAPEALTAVHARLRAMLAEQSATLDGIFACPHREEDNCDCRKPKVGLTRQAAAALGLDLSRVVVAGDKLADLGLARALGVPAFLVMTGSGPDTLAENSLPADFVVDGLDDLARIVTHPAGVGRPVTTHSS
jgi:D-glycero-D-manno-heptose 1,7-bisphosphate phosphatase